MISAIETVTKMYRTLNNKLMPNGEVETTRRRFTSFVNVVKDQNGSLKAEVFEKSRAVRVPLFIFDIPPNYSTTWNGDTISKNGADLRT